MISEDLPVPDGASMTMALVDSTSDVSSSVSSSRPKKNSWSSVRYGFGPGKGFVEPDGVDAAGASASESIDRHPWVLWRRLGDATVELGGGIGRVAPVERVSP